MSGLLTIFIRLLVLYLVVKVILSLFAGRKNTIPQNRKKRGQRVERFDTSGENVADGDFEDLS